MIDVVTFGCRLNAFESEAIKASAQAAGVQEAIIFNTCAVTSEAERQARQAIRRARREHPNARIIVTGCAAQINPEAFAAMAEVTQVIGNREKMAPATFESLEQLPKIHVQDIMTVTETAGHLVASFEDQTRAFVEIQNGCNHRCTFCTIPFGRGNNRSVPMGVIVDQVRQLVASGYPEIVFTGVDITDYGTDLPGKPTLGQMTKRLLAQIPELKRLRLSSLDPVEVDDDLMVLMGAEPRLLPHFHISLQAGNDLILKRMKRRHLSQDVIDFCARVRARRPEAVFGADIICGFPTETEEQFQDTLTLVDTCNLTYIHAFPYSSRPGTPAARMPQVPQAAIKERAQRLREKGQQKLRAYLDTLVGTRQRVLVERNGNARTDTFALVHLGEGTPAPGSLCEVRVTGRENTYLIGDLLS